MKTFRITMYCLLVFLLFLNLFLLFFSLIGFLNIWTVILSILISIPNPLIFKDLFDYQEHMNEIVEWKTKLYSMTPEEHREKVRKLREQGEIK